MGNVVVNHSLQAGRRPQKRAFWPAEVSDPAMRAREKAHVVLRQGLACSAGWTMASPDEAAWAEAVSLLDNPEQLWILLPSRSRLEEARVLQHSAQLDLVQMRTEEARELSARANKGSATCGSTAAAEWQLVFLTGMILGTIAICLVLLLFCEGARNDIPKGLVRLCRW